MTISVRRAQALAREAAYGDALRALEHVDSWADLRAVVDELHESKRLATETVADLS